MDPCECLTNEMNHQLAMRRILSLLRQSQSACTDAECFDEFPLSQAPEAESSSFMMMAMVWFMIAVVLYFLRPQSLRNRDDSKPKFNGPDNNGPSPGTADLN